MKTWVIILIVLVFVFVVVPLIYFAIIAKNVDWNSPTGDGGEWKAVDLGQFNENR